MSYLVNFKMGKWPVVNGEIFNPLTALSDPSMGLATILGLLQQAEWVKARELVAQIEERSKQYAE